MTGRKIMIRLPGTLSNLSFNLRDALGNIHRLSDYGQSLSFVLTWAMKD